MNNYLLIFFFFLDYDHVIYTRLCTEHTKMFLCHTSIWRRRSQYSKTNLVQKRQLSYTMPLWESDSSTSDGLPPRKYWKRLMQSSQDHLSIGLVVFVLQKVQKLSFMVVNCPSYFKLWKPKLSPVQVILTQRDAHL